jgi:hypothetical protein
MADDTRTIRIAPPLEAEARMWHTRIRARLRAMRQPDLDREVLRLQLRAVRLGQPALSESRLRRGDRYA